MFVRRAFLTTNDTNRIGCSVFALREEELPRSYRPRYTRRTSPSKQDPYEVTSSEEQDEKPIGAFTTYMLFIYLFILCYEISVLVVLAGGVEAGATTDVLTSAEL